MRTSNKLYSMGAVDKAVEELIRMDYEVIEMQGSLLDDYMCIAPNESMYNFYFYEVFLNSQSSAYKVQRFVKLKNPLKERFCGRYWEQDEETQERIDEVFEKIF